MGSKVSEMRLRILYTSPKCIQGIGNGQCGRDRVMNFFESLRLTIRSLYRVREQLISKVAV